jgi:hypothetical protein
MPNKDPKLVSGLDCTSIKDFYQYYKQRYFGLLDDDKVTILPAFVNYSAPAPKDHLAVGIYKPKTKTVEEGIINWGYIGTNGRLGCPVLGNTPIGPTYAFLMGQPYRESYKGICLARCRCEMPNSDFIYGKYAHVNPNIVKMTGSKQYFGTSYEMETVYNIYNKAYYPFEDAVELLERGSLLGASITRSCGLYTDENNPDVLLSYKGTAAVGRLTQARANDNRIEIKPTYKYLVPAIQHSLPDSVLVR